MARLSPLFPGALLRPACVAVVASALLAGCQPAGGVRIGFLGDLISELGAGGRNGAQLAVESLNASNRGHYELLVEDDRNDANVARAALSSFATRHAAFVVGPMTSAMAVAAVPQANRLRLVLISPTATTDELSGKTDYFFRTAADASAGARQLAGVLHARGVRSIVVLMDISNGAYSSSFGHAAAMEFLHLGGARAPEIGYWSGKSLDFATALREVDGASPEAIVLVNSPSDAAIATQHLRRSLPGTLIALSPWGANVQFIQIGGRSADGALALQAVDLQSTLPRMRDFVSRYRQRFGQAPTTPAVQAYEAVIVGVDALNRGGAADLRATLAVPRQWEGLDGNFAIDGHGDATRALHMVQVRDGRFEPLAH